MDQDAARGVRRAGAPHLPAHGYYVAASGDLNARRRGIIRIIEYFKIIRFLVSFRAAAPGKIRYRRLPNFEQWFPVPSDPALLQTVLVL
jgi:hypothetical protein